MVTIIKGSRKLSVPKGAFDSIYAPNGWKLVEDVKNDSRDPNPAPKSSEENHVHPKDKNENLTPLNEDLEKTTKTSKNFDENIDDEDEEEEVEYVDPEELEEKPLEELDFEELKILADYYGIKTRGLKSKKDVRNAIEQYRAKK